MAKVRNERLREELKKTVSAIIFDMKDPRIPAVTSITEMEVTPDLKYAKAHVSVFDADENAAKTAKKAYKDNISLKEACVELGFLTAEKFDEVFHPEEMV